MNQRNATSVKILFKQPECSHLGDCPICCLPFPLDAENNALYSCFGKVICEGCDVANCFHGNLEKLCPFCRQPPALTEEEHRRFILKRTEANDPVAIYQMGCYLSTEDSDTKGAFEYWTRAAELGDIDAHCALSVLYQYGEFVEKDESKQEHHLETAAIGGHVQARYKLACLEGNRGRYERAAKHWVIASKLGCDRSLDRLKDSFKNGFISKDDFAAALRGHQAATDAMKSPKREAARAVKAATAARLEKISSTKST
mmetsp:Transcript_18729/g.30680  ORF Transcript_18729/g.30680 Transcript_18729/m.30680 type:complete len:257 (-) Transcript_18729:147-917(-)